MPFVYGTYSSFVYFCGSITQFSASAYAIILAMIKEGQSDMEDYFDSAIHEVVEDFENIPTTEDTRTGIDRRHLEAKEFPLKDSNGNVVAEDRRTQEDRRSEDIDIDDISEYVQEVH